MNDKITDNNPPLLAPEELAALMQRKAALQAQLQAGAGACASTGAGTCPSCQCGSSSAESALPTEKSRLFKIALVALLLLVTVGLALQL